MRFLAALATALVLAGPALASEQHPTRVDLEDEIVCPTCRTTLDLSSSPIAERMKEFISARIAAGDTKSEIKAELVAQFGPEVLATPQRRGFDLLAWLLPIGGALVAAAVLGGLAWRWSRNRAPAAVVAGGPALEPELERRLDDELRRFDA